MIGIKEKNQGLIRRNSSSAPPPGNGDGGGRADADLAPIDLLWRDGLPLVRFLTGRGDASSRSLLGRLLSCAKGDAVSLLAAIREGRSMRPLLQAEAWLMAAARERGRPKPKSRFRSALEYARLLGIR